MSRMDEPDLTPSWAPKMTKVILRGLDGDKFLAAPEILWPPRGGIPDVLHVGGKTFINISIAPFSLPAYKLARTHAITGIDIPEEVA